MYTPETAKVVCTQRFKYPFLEPLLVDTHQVDKGKLLMKYMRIY